MPSKKPARTRKAPADSRRPFPVVCIGASAGGLDAFNQLLDALAPDTGMAFVIIQHLEPSHPSGLPTLLARKTHMPVTEARDGTRVQRNQVYVIPPNSTMEMSRGALRLAPRPSGKVFLPINTFMSSLAAERRSQAVGVILSGTASDGTLGLEAIKAEGGTTFAQEEATAQHDGMPSSAIASGCVDFVLAPAEIARELVRIGRDPQAPPSPADGESRDDAVEADHGQFRRIFELLRRTTRIDFASYKRSTLRRRIERRMTLLKFATLEDYVDYLQKTRGEAELLSQDLLIHVTSFFRDAPVFQLLKKKVFPALLKQRKDGDLLRIWVPGCSTGEEAYSIGMALLECLGKAGPSPPCQIFGTDVSETAIHRARSGFYAEDIKHHVSRERLRRFFVKTAGGYRISKSVRDLCIFARQDLAKDPPFSKLDLISCRNVMIYLGPALQRRIFPIFHYSLRQGGYLLLGSAESTGAFGSLFTTVDRTRKLFMKKQGSKDSPLGASTPPASRTPAVREIRMPERPVTENDLFKEVDRLVLSRYAPPGVLLNDDLEVLQFRGRTTLFLEHAPGKPTVNVLKLLREDLIFPLRSAAEKAVKEKAAVRTRVIQIRADGAMKSVILEVVPLRSPLSDKPFLLVLFHEVDGAPGTSNPKAARITVKEETRLVTQLRRELAAVREELQKIIEEQEAAQEEFKSANEEILSSNEELQSTNEELETAKEELQSANEELTTLNEEVTTRNTELGQINSDITNILAGINIPILILSQDLRIRRFTPVAGALLNLIPGDVGRPISDINPNLEISNFRELVAEVVDTMTVKERHVRSRDGHWYLMRIRPYRTLESRIDGATVAFLDIDVLKKAQEADAVMEAVRNPIVVLAADHRVLSANRYFYRYFATTEQEIVNQSIFQIARGQWNTPSLRELLESLLTKKKIVEDYVIESSVEAHGRRKFLVNARRLPGEGGSDDRLIIAFEDITNRS